MRIETTELRCTTGGSFKQYTVKVAVDDSAGRASVIISYGRIGAKQNTYTKVQDVTERKAQEEAQRLIDTKLRKGYLHTRPGPKVSKWLVQHDESVPAAPASQPPALNFGLAGLLSSRRKSFSVQI